MFIAYLGIESQPELPGWWVSVDLREHCHTEPLSSVALFVLSLSDTNVSSV